MNDLIFVLLMVLIYSLTCVHPKTITSRQSTDVTIEQIPYVAYLEFEFIDRKGALVYYRCTGTILSARWILTAAHCTTRPNLTLSNKKYGIGDLQELYPIDSIIAHQSYKHIEYLADFDVAVIHTKPEIKLSKNVKPVVLTRSKKVSEMCVIMGYMTVNLREANLSLTNIKLHVFSLYYSSISVDNDSKLFIILSTENPFYNGGPLICDGRQVAIASEGKFDEGKYVIPYNFIANQSEWLKNKTLEDLFKENVISTDYIFLSGCDMLVPFSYMPVITLYVYIIGYRFFMPGFSRL